jgi:hypothetical protein
LTEMTLTMASMKGNLDGSKNLNKRMTG